MDLLGQRELLSMYLYNFVKIRNGSNMETEFNAIHCLPHLHMYLRKFVSSNEHLPVNIRLGKGLGSQTWRLTNHMAIQYQGCDENKLSLVNFMFDYW